MTSSTNFNTSIDLASQSLGQFFSAEEKNKEKSKKALTELAALLQKLEGVVSHGASASSAATAGSSASCASGSSSSNPASTAANDASSVLQAAQNLAVIEQFLQQMESSTSDKNMKNFLIIEEAQVQAMAQAYQKAEQQLNALTQGLQNFFNLCDKNSFMLNFYMSETSCPHWYELGFVQEADPDITDAQALVQNLFNQSFPGMSFTITIDPDTQDYSSFKQQVTTEVNNFVSNATSSIMSSLNAFASTPFLKQIATMISGSGALSTEQLKMLAKIVQQCVQAITTQKASNGAESSDGPSNTLLVSVMSMMNEAMSSVQEIIAQSSSEKGQMDQQIGQAMLNQAQQNLNHIQNEIQKIANEESAEKALGVFMKVITAVVTAVVAAACIATGNIGMAVMAVALCVAQETGGFSALSGQIADLLEDMGVSSDVANWVADAIVIVITIAATAGAGALDSVGTVAADAAGAAVSSTASGAAEAAETTASTATEDILENIGNVLKKAWEIFMKVNPFSRLSAMMNMAIVNSLQAAMGTNIVSDIATYVLTKKGYTQDEIQDKLVNIDKWASIAMGVVMFLAGTAMANGMTNTATNDLSTTMGKLRQTLQDFMQSSGGMALLSKIQAGVSIVGSLGQGAGGIATGVYQKEQADSTAELGVYEALQQIIQMVQTSASRDASQTGQSSGNMLSSNLKNNIANMNKIYAEGALVAQILAQQAV